MQLRHQLHELRAVLRDYLEVKIQFNATSYGERCNELKVTILFDGEEVAEATETINPWVD